MSSFPLYDFLYNNFAPFRLALLLYQILKDRELRNYYIKYYTLSLLTIIIMYLVISGIFCSIFQISYTKFFKSTIIPIVGIFILLIQQIINLFYLPYNVSVIVINTFHYFTDIIKIIYKWINNLIYTTLNMEDYVLNNL